MFGMDYDELENALVLREYLDRAYGEPTDPALKKARASLDEYIQALKIKKALHTVAEYCALSTEEEVTELMDKAREKAAKKQEEADPDGILAHMESEKRRLHEYKR